MVETQERDLPEPTEVELAQARHDERAKAVKEAARLVMGGDRDARLRRPVLFLIAFVAIGFGVDPIALGAVGLLALTDAVVTL